jgi:predicted acetyltransferase
MRYIKDSSTDRQDEILDFANMVFSMEYTGIDFSTYLPKAYGDIENGKVTHHMLLAGDKDKIVGLIDTYPVKLCVGELGSISADYVGTVAVHPRHRGMGYFSNLMNKVYKEAVANNIDLLIVDGEKSRYGNFGYEKAGTRYHFDITFKSALSTCKDEPPCFSFEEIDSEDTHAIDIIYKLYSTRHVTARSRKDFYVSLLTNKSSVYAVTKQGKIKGYVNMSSDEKNIHELELSDESDLPKLILDLLEGFELGEIAVNVGADEISKIKYLEKLSSYYSITQSHQIRIINYEKVIRFLLIWKQQYTEIIDGEYIFGIIRPEGEAHYIIKVESSQITVEATDKITDDIFTEREFVKIFTTNYYYLEKIDAPAGWFPLPFYLPEADTF